MESIAMRYPHLANQWHKQNVLALTDIFKPGHKKGWWICEKGHEWESSVDSRMRGVGCP